jgi:hypothetical protein
MDSMKKSLLHGRLLAVVVLVLVVVVLLVRRDADVGAVLAGLAAVLTAVSKFREVKRSRSQSEDTTQEDQPAEEVEA